MGERYGLYKNNSGLWRSLMDGDFEEEDVWDVLKERTSMESRSPFSSDSMPLLSAAKMIPVPSSKSAENEGLSLRKSAPANVPRWPETYPRKSVEASPDDGGGEEDDEDDGGKLPPHEFIARRLARNHISSFSVLEGAGRTLKGRDLSKVRNAVLIKTGFLR